MEKNIAVIWGDCSSPEIVKQTIRVLDKVAEKYGHTFHYTDAAMGGEAIDKYGDPLPQHELDKCLAADSVLLGAVGGPKWEGLPGEQRPEKGLLRLRAGMGLYSNNRPAKIWPQLAPASPLKPEIVAQGIDFIIVRELIGGVYFGNHETHTLASGEKQAIDSMPYAEHEIERIGRIGFETARKRRKKLCCVDKANVLDTSRLWRSVMHRLQAEYPDVEYSEMFVDNCAMQIVKNPAQFDVIVTENMFGDILSDEASMITGSIGMIPSSSLGDGTRGLYEPIHGSAPDIAGKDIVNPTACILSAAMMLRYSFGLTAGSRRHRERREQGAGQGPAHRRQHERGLHLPWLHRHGRRHSGRDLSFSITHKGERQPSFPFSSAQKRAAVPSCPSVIQFLTWCRRCGRLRRPDRERYSRSRSGGRPVRRGRYPHQGVPRAGP